MSETRIVFGYIEYSGNPSDVWINDYNKKVIDQLPEYDLLGITRSMFTVLPMNESFNPPLEKSYPQYDVQLITFAASYKRGYNLPQRWIDKFEDLLTRLYWWNAEVLVDTVGLKYQYSWQNITGRSSALPPPKQEWGRIAYELWHSVEIPWEQAIDFTLL